MSLGEAKCMKLKACKPLVLGASSKSMEKKRGPSGPHFYSCIHCEGQGWDGCEASKKGWRMARLRACA